ncbi:oxidoreductase [Lichenicola sp.]|uniref:oxidoreductase n=1 Tax=Lichenicola sp. TaxID=2804529 RepID=UPI003B008E44
MTAWTTASIPDQSGRRVIITGASSGIGETAAAALAARGAEVVLAVRDQRRGDATRKRILARHPDARLSVSLLDMADLSSVRAFADRMLGESGSGGQVDVLLNNAGLGMQAARAVTVDGFERQFGTNHLGHFALTGLLMPALLKAPAPRVVAISSIAHRRGRIDFTDLQGERGYNGSKAYSQSKLANLMFALELDRRARAAHSRLVSVAAHPGIAATGFVAAIGMPRVMVTAVNLGIGVFGQDAAQGALPGLYAATMPDVIGGEFWGPDGFLEIRGAPKSGRISAHALDRAVWQRLWTISEQLTGVTYPALGS